MRAALIVNPFATRVTEESVAAVEAILRPVATAWTERPGHASELAAGLAGDVDALIVFSGDGGYNELLNGLTRDVAVGFVPGGGTSVLPRALGLPRDPLEAARQIVRGRERRISLGRANGRRFAFSAGLGLDAEIVRRVDALGRRPDGRRPGDGAFVREVARALAARRGRLEPVLEIEGHGTAALAIALNDEIYTYAGPVPLRLARGARFELGIDLVAPRRIGPVALPALVAFVAGGPAPRSLVHLHDRDRIVLRADSPLPLQVDGEDLGDVTEVELEAERSALSVLV